MASSKHKEKIIVIIDYNKEYILYLLSEIKNKLDIFFLFYSYPSEITSLAYKNYGKIIFWKDYNNAFELLKSINPNLVVFFELETLNEVALNVSCKELKIKTVFSDHGLQDFEISKSANEYIKKSNNNFSFFNKKLLLIMSNTLQDIFNNRRFYNRTIKKSGHSDFLKLYKSVRLKNTILDTYLKIKSNLLLPDKYICFSPENYNFHQRINHNAHLPVNFVGWPELDNFFHATENPTPNDKDFVIFIDQPYVAYKYYGWNYSNKKSFLHTLKKKVEEKAKSLLIKQHPRETEFWQTLDSAFNFISTEELLLKKNKISHVIGYNSTLLLPFAATEDIFIYNLRNHPDKHTPNSTSLVDFRVAKWFDSMAQNELFSEPQIETFQLNQSKKEFINQYLFAFDGKSMDRFNKAILNECN